MAVSTFFLAFAGTWVTERVVEPRLGAPVSVEAPPADSDLSESEKRGLRSAAVAAGLFALVILVGTVPAAGFLRDAETRDLLHSPFLSGIVAIIFLGGLTVGLAYGLAAGTFRSDTDVVNSMSKAMAGLGSYLVLVFFAAQFVAFFNWTNLGLILAVNGAGLLESSGFGGIPLMVSFVLLTSFVNLFMGSASAKWAIMAPVFVPMFMLLGYSPELTQATYRVGDSVSNIVSPMMSYFALIVAFVQRYDAKAGIGTVVALMAPYTLAFLVVWTILLCGWIALGLPVGPGAELYLPEASAPPLPGSECANRLLPLCAGLRAL
jgi:aminobenzoyl-glutamate transport protein